MERDALRMREGGPFVFAQVQDQAVHIFIYLFIYLLFFTWAHASCKQHGLHVNTKIIYWNHGWRHLSTACRWNTEWVWRISWIIFCKHGKLQPGINADKRSHDIALYLACSWCTLSFSMHKPSIGFRINFASFGADVLETCGVSKFPFHVGREGKVDHALKFGRGVENAMSWGLQ